MKRRTFYILLILFGLILTACASTEKPTAVATSNNNTAPVAESELSLVRTDAQGSVAFTVEPLNLDSSGETLEFMISMETHSVDLAWDLAAQSVLTNDAGLQVTGLSWPVGTGHHLEGTLTFPTQTADGQSLLAGAKSLTLTIRNAGADERVFTWEVLP